MNDTTMIADTKLHGPLDNCRGWSTSVKTLAARDTNGRDIAIVVGSGSYQISKGRLAEIEAAYGNGSR